MGAGRDAYGDVDVSIRPFTGSLWRDVSDGARRKAGGVVVAFEGESHPPWRFTRSRIIAKNFSTDSPLRIKQSTFCIVGGGAPE